jgi:hypothetical protein
VVLDMNRLPETQSGIQTFPDTLFMPVSVYMRELFTCASWITAVLSGNSSSRSCLCFTSMLVVLELDQFLCETDYVAM